MTLTIDFYTVQDMKDFYRAFSSAVEVPEYFGENLDALYDFISGDAELPMEIHFINMNFSQLEIFESLIELFDDLDDALEDFHFKYSIVPIDF